MKFINAILKNNQRKAQAAFTLWWFVWLGIHTAILNDNGIFGDKALMDSFASIILLAAFSVLVVNNMRYYLPKKEKYFYLFFISIALSALWLMFLRFVLWSVYKNDEVYLDWLKHTTTLRFCFGFLMIGTNTLLSLLWYTQKEHSIEIERRASTESIAKDAELNKLRQQLQPHFLFNSLNSISALAGSQPEKARLMIQQLSQLLRSTLKNEDALFSTFENELKNLELYLDIEKVRFGHRLQTKINFNDEILALKLPAMILQPLVENAIKFGLYDTLDDVLIEINASVENNVLKIQVTNPYDGVTAKTSKGEGFGLSSIKRRLYLLFARYDLLLTTSNEKTFTASLNIPQLNN